MIAASLGLQTERHDQEHDAECEKFLPGVDQSYKDRIYFGQMSLLGSVFGFGKKKSPEETAKECIRTLNKQSRAMAREIAKHEQSERNARKSIQSYIKKGHPEAARLLAKEVVSTVRAINRKRMCQSQLESFRNSLQSRMLPGCTGCTA